MNVTPEEAQEALAAIQQTTVKTRRGLAQYAYQQVVWGLLWFVGFLVSQFVQPAMLNWIWIAVPIVGAIGSGIVGISQGRRMRVTQDSRLAFISSRVGIFFPILYVFGVMWFVIFQPLNALQIALFWITLVMFSYVVAGAWLRTPLLIGIGVGVTVMSLLGYYLLPGYFYLWSALFAGGTLLGSGIYILLRWR
jgi:hypothetical protein